MLHSAGTLSGVSFGTGSCSVLLQVGMCSNSQVATQGGLSSANWIGVSSAGAINSANSDGGNFFQIDAAGSASCFFFSSAQLPVSWDVFIDNNAGGVSNWDVLFQVNLTEGNFFVHPSGVDSAVGRSEIKGSATIQMSDKNVTGYEIFLQAVNSVNSSFSVNVPGGETLDLNPASVTTTPEPSGLLLAAAGVAGLLWRRKKSQGIA